MRAGSPPLGQASVYPKCANVVTRPCGTWALIQSGLSANPSRKGETIVARARFIQLAGVGLLLAAAIQISLTIYVRMMISARVAIPVYSLRPAQIVVSAALLLGIVALVVAQETIWAGSATSALG